jgi:hypothetical protein
MDKIKPLFTATATATGGRNGHTESSDGMVRADLSVPQAMGGPGRPGTATPERLFAAGYAACFGGEAPSLDRLTSAVAMIAGGVSSPVILISCLTASCPAPCGVAYQAPTPLGGYAWGIASRV